MIPSPNIHNHDVGVFVDLSVNCTVNGAVPDVVFSVKLATGAGTVPVIVWEAEVPLPPALVAVRVTVYVPADV